MRRNNTQIPANLQHTHGHLKISHFQSLSNSARSSSSIEWLWHADPWKFQTHNHRQCDHTWQADHQPGDFYHTKASGDAFNVPGIWSDNQIAAWEGYDFFFQL
ncbi:hypothetical protein BGY98DRAFT_679933 [Russula aff. rugulosa BPL654]|nr:hypothetical protein BGY98DRAFT_679933 [Russula aff. rugulosa BPL654]